MLNNYRFFDCGFFIVCVFPKSTIITEIALGNDAQFARRYTYPFQHNTDCDGYMDRRRHIYYASHAISLLKMINSDINYMNLRFGIGAINSIK